MRVSNPDNDPRQRAIRVLHVGPSLSAKGGIAAVLSGYAANRDLFRSLGVELCFLQTCGSAGVAGLLTFPSAWLKLVSAVLLRKLDIVHIHSSIRGSLLRKWPLAMTCVFLRQKFVLHLHSGATEPYVARLPLIVRTAVGLLWTRANQVVCLSGDMQAWLKKRCASTSDRIRLIYNGLSDPLNTGLQRKPSVTEPTILFLGKLSEAKGVTVLLRAAHALKLGGHSYRLLVGGNGDIQAFDREVERLALSDRVKYLGWVAGSTKAQLLSSADIFVLPSRSEGFPVSIVEAMAYRVAIASTNISGVVDAITHGKEGLLVPPDDIDELTDALAMLLTRPELRMRLGEAARQRFLSDFTIQRSAEDLVETYQRAMK